MRTYNMSNHGREPKYYYLYKQIRQDILTGELKKNEKLPSKRSLAEHLGLGLITVENAYQLLKDEGYIETRERSGYFVCELQGIRMKTEEVQQLELLPEPGYTDAKAAYKPISDEGDTPDDSRPMPYSLYFKTIRSVISEYGELLMEKSPNEGCAILRNSIARYLLRYRGIFVQPEQIIIGSGAEHLYNCVLRMLGKDRIYGIEDPSYSQIQKVYEGGGATCDLLKMGRHGIESRALEATKATVLHVTPFHSYPSGISASVAKRYEYLDWAAERGGLIVEDDFDSEFFMPGKPVETLYALDGGKHVIYINTFSNSLSPSIRMGYMIVPQNLLEQYRRTNGGFSCTVPVLEQYALAEFINKGYFEQHLNRTRRHRRQD